MIENIVDILFENAQKYPDKIAIIHKKEKLYFIFFDICVILLDVGTNIN